MSNATRGRSALGSRTPGPVDLKSVLASRFHYNNGVSLNFGGVDEYVAGPTLSSVGTFTNQITVAIWFKWGETATQWQGVCNATESWSTLGQGFCMYWDHANSLKFFINGYGSNFATASVSSADGLWHHAVGVYDGSLGGDNIKLYIDGVVGGVTDDYVSNINTSNNVEIGRTANAATPSEDHSVGHLDEFGIWNKGLSSGEVAALYNGGAPTSLAFNGGGYDSSDNLRLWWRNGDQGDSTGADGIQDQSLTGNHGTMTNMESGDFSTDVPGA